MAITSIPTRTDGSAGRVKSDASAVTNLNTQIPAVEFNVIASAVCDVVAEMGLSDGSIPGSIVARVNALEGSLGDAVSIQGIPVDPTPPTLNQSLVFDGASYVPTTGAAATLDNVMTLPGSDNDVTLPVADPLILRGSATALLKVGGALDEVTVNQGLITLLGKANATLAIETVATPGATDSGQIVALTGDTVDGNAGPISLFAGNASGTGDGGSIIITGGNVADAAAIPGPIAFTTGLNSSTSDRADLSITAKQVNIETDTSTVGLYNTSKSLALSSGAVTGADVHIMNGPPHTNLTAAKGALCLEISGVPEFYQNIDASTYWLKFDKVWGSFATAAGLPNGSGNVISGSVFNSLKIGTVSYVTGTSSLYVCTSVGTSGGGDAVWAALGFQSSITTLQTQVTNLQNGIQSNIQIVTTAADTIALGTTLVYVDHAAATTTLTIPAASSRFAFTIIKRAISGGFGIDLTPGSGSDAIQGLAAGVTFSIPDSTINASTTTCRPSFLVTSSANNVVDVS